jgi:tetratricopeptide (TPR) repeat protein
MSKKSINTSLILVGLGLLFLALVGIRTISTPVLWSHLAQGSHAEAISYVETISVANCTILYDRLLLFFYNLGGAPLLIILNTIALLATFILLLQVGKKWGGAISQAFALLITGHLLFQGFDVGPQTCMMLFIALFVFILSAPRKPVILFASLIPLQILWTHIHATFLFGPLIALLATIQVMQQDKGGNRKRGQANRGNLYIMLTLLLFLATLANPYHIRMHLQVIQSLRQPMPFYWASLFLDYFQVSSRDELIFFTLILGAAGLITLKKRLPFMLSALAIIGSFLVIRNPQAIQLFTALAFPFMVLSFTAVGEALSSSLKTILAKKEKMLTPVTIGILALLFVLSGIPIVTNCAYVQLGSASTFGLGVEENLYPAGAESILNHPDFPERAFNLAADGGYLAFKYDRKVFLHMRSGYYSKALIEEVGSMLRGNNDAYNSIIDKYRPKAIILNTLDHSVIEGSLARLLLRPQWKLAYFDGSTAILVVNEERYASIFNDKTIQQSGMARLEAAKKAYKDRLDKGCSVGNSGELIGAGQVYLSLNRPGASKEIFQLLLEGNDRVPGSWVGLGRSQVLLKEFEAAIASLKRATELAPDSFTAWAHYADACKRGKKNEAYKQAQERVERIVKKMEKRGKKATKADEPKEKEEAPNALLPETMLPGNE